ncbi:MAG TPA: SDR family oxidoreductase [Oculatellaceae cyanobacterium]
MILVTGATGNIGSEVVKQLVAKGKKVRVVSRDAAKLAGIPAGVEKVVGEISDASTLLKAVDGADEIFLFPLIHEEDHKSMKAILKEAKKAGTSKVVMLSSLGARSGTQNAIGKLHREKEELVEASGIDWALVRPGSFMTNTFQWLPTIKSLGTVFNPTGDGKVAPISPRDIAAVSVAALTENHVGKIFELTGPELLSTPEQAEILAKATGLAIKCVDVPAEQAAEQAQKSGLPGFIATALGQMWSRIKSGQLAVVTHDVQQVTGNTGETFKEWCERNRAAFLN